MLFENPQGEPRNPVHKIDEQNQSRTLWLYRDQIPLNNEPDITYPLQTFSMSTQQNVYAFTKLSSASCWSMDNS